jgi:hypothetical protein
MIDPDAFEKTGTIHNQERTFKQFGGILRHEMCADQYVSIDLEFRRATNGGIVNTIVNGEPLITTEGW